MTDLTYQEAKQRALDWAEGRLSHLNTMMSVEASPDDRQRTLVATAQADAAEVEKWTAVARLLLEEGQPS